MLQAWLRLELPKGGRLANVQGSHLFKLPQKILDTDYLVK